MAEAEINTLHRWNLQELLVRLEDDRELLRELLLMFREDAHSNLEKGRLLLAKRDLPGLSRVAHTLKGMLKNLSMQEAAEIAAALETAASQRQETESIDSFQKLENAIAAVEPEVSAQLAELKA